MITRVGKPVYPHILKCTMLAQVLALKDHILMHNSNGIPFENE